MNYVVAKTYTENCPCCLSSEYQGYLFLFNMIEELLKEILDNWGTFYYRIYSTETGDIIGDVGYEIRTHHIVEYKVTFNNDVYFTADKGNGQKTWQQSKILFL